jgi:ABC-type branched-subunit amino acid transport system substrate-binding protein
LIARTTVLAMVAALVAVVTTPVVGGAAPSVRGFDGTTLTIGGMGLHNNFPDGANGAQGRFQRFNETNEIKGIKIDYVGYLDDKQDPATALSVARQLVQQEQVFAIVPNLSQYTPGDYLTQQKVPWFGWGFDASYCSPSPKETLYGFGYNGCLIPPDPKRMPDSGGQLYKYVSEQAGTDKPTLAMFSNETDSGKNAVATQASGYAGAGFDIVYAKGLLPPPPINDVTPYVQELLTSNDGGPPDAMVCLLSIDCLPVWAQLQANNYEGVYQSTLYSDLLLTPLAGTVASVQFVPFGENTPAQQQMIEDIHAFKEGAAINSGVAASYFAADMLISTLKTLKKQGKDITPENVQAQAAKTSFEVKGLFGPTKFPNSFVRPTPACTAIVSDTGSSWETVEPFFCSNRTFKVQQKYLDAA